MIGDAWPAWSIDDLLQLRWSEVPRIPAVMTRSIVYVYASEQDANEGRPFGATGFVIGVEPFIGRGKSPTHNYVVVNRHEIDPHERIWVRFTRSTGGTFSKQIDRDDWTPDPNGADLAILALDYPSPIDVVPVPAAALAKRGSFGDDRPEEQDNERALGGGDEVVMIGRYVNIDGGPDANEPLQRFGHLMKTRPVMVKNTRGDTEDLFLVEMDSRPGFSGSPVWIYRTARFREDEKYGIVIEPVESSPITLLGIDKGHHPVWADVVTRDSGMEAAIDRDRVGVKSESGVAMVVPGWKIGDLLEQFRDERHDRERAWANRTPQVEDDAAVEADTTERDAFIDLLGKLSQVPKSEVDELRRRERED